MRRVRRRLGLGSSAVSCSRVGLVRKAGSSHRDHSPITAGPKNPGRSLPSGLSLVAHRCGPSGSIRFQTAPGERPVRRQSEMISPPNRDWRLHSRGEDVRCAGVWLLRRRLLNLRRPTRNGFTPVVRAQLTKRFKPLEIKTCPFANLPEAKSGRCGGLRRRRWPIAG
jgi:hypothetical protein